jgi:uncharacterized membrane protein
VTDPPTGQRTTIFRESGLIVVFLITLVYDGVVFLAPGSAVQVPLGFVELLFAPGYALGAIAFIRKPLLPPAAEFSITVGLSVIFNVLVGLLLALFSLGLAVVWLVVADTAVVWIGLIVKVVWEEAPGVTGVSDAIRRELRLPGVRPSYRNAVYALLVASLVAFAGVVYLSTAQPSTAPSTSLAIYGPTGTTASLPKQLTVGEVGLVVLSISDGYSTGPIVLVVTAVDLNKTTSVTPVPWTLPLTLTPGATSSLPLGLGYGGQTSETVTFEFPQQDDYALTFTLEAAGGALLQEATLSLVVSTS